jgi:hypothetical protein
MQILRQGLAENLTQKKDACAPNFLFHQMKKVLHARPEMSYLVADDPGKYLTFDPLISHT